MNENDMTDLTLWRIESDFGEPGVFPPADLSDWIQEMQQANGHWSAKGCWFTDAPETLDWYARDMMVEPPIPFRVVSIHVPAAEAESYRVRNLSIARRFSKDWDTEFFVPKDWARTATRDTLMMEQVLTRVATARLSDRLVP